MKSSAAISPVERAKGIEPTASHVLAWPIIVSYAFRIVHFELCKFLLTTTFMVVLRSLGRSAAHLAPWPSQDAAKGQMTDGAPASSF